MTTKLLIIGALSVAACGAQPTAPSVVEFRETNIGSGTPAFLFTICIIPVSCTVERRIQNVGNTCATEVHATITPLDSSGNALATCSWVHIPTVVVRPLDSVEIRLVDVPYAVVQAAARWRITPGWRQTAC
jgi:hypothetical protein